MPGGTDYSQEAIDIILSITEEHKDKLVVILAGYDENMNTRM